MKIVFLFLLFYCSVSCAQGFVCNYSEEKTPINIKASLFGDDEGVSASIDRIVKQVGLEKNFVLIKDFSINNCCALMYQGVRVIVYDPLFLNKVNNATNRGTSWASLSILAHEVGHHLQGHTVRAPLNYQDKRKMELEADKFSGFIMQSLGATLEQSLAAIKSIRNISQTINSTHPEKELRIKAVTDGYIQSRAISIKVLNDNLRYLETQKALFVKKEIEVFSKEMYYNKAQSCVIKQNLDCALDYLTTIITLGQGDFMALTQRALIKSMKGDYSSALVDYSGVIEKFNTPNMNPGIKFFLANHVYYNRAIVYEQRLDYSNAVSDYNKALELLNGNDQIIWLKLASAYFELAQYDYAQFCFEKGFEKPIEQIGLQNFTLADIYLKRGSTYLFTNLANKAIADFNKAIELYPSNHPKRLEPYFFLGLSYSALNNNNQSIRSFKRFLHDAQNGDNDNKIAMANYYIGIDYQKEFLISSSPEALDSSIYHFSTSFKQNPQNTNVLYYRGLSYQLKKDKKNACVDFKIACDMKNEKACELYKNCK